VSALPIFIAAAVINRRSMREEEDRRAKKACSDRRERDEGRDDRIETASERRQKGLLPYNTTQDPGPSGTIQTINAYSRQERPDLDALCADLGLKVLRLKLHPDVTGMIDHDRRLMIVNQDSTSERQRFTLAHQIGHWMYDREALRVHGGSNDGRDYRGIADAPSHNPSIRPQEETRANKMAIHLLMSTDVVSRLHGEGLTTAEIAKRLGTTKASMKIRLETLDLENRD
jgi:Zn-dependent peptidase ImmA (M78 family)